MGVVHLAQGPDGRRVALKVLRPHIVGDTEARERLAREVSSLQRITSPRIAEILDADPHGAGALRGHPLRARALALPPRRRGGPDRRRRPAALRRLPRRGAAGRPLGRRAAPRHQADQRVDGGPLAGPHRLRPGPGGRGPAAHPDRLAARARRATSRRRSCTATTPPSPPTCTPGRRPWRSRRPAGRRTARGRRWRSWTGSAAASTTSPACRTAAPAAARVPRRRAAGPAGGASSCALRSHDAPPAARTSRPPAPDPELWTMPFAPPRRRAGTTGGTGASRAGPRRPRWQQRRAATRAEPTPVHPRRHRSSRRHQCRPGPAPSDPVPAAGAPRSTAQQRHSACCSCSASVRSTGARSAYAPYLGTALVATAGPAAAHRVGHPAAARPPADDPRAAPVVRRADDHALHARLCRCSRCSVRWR